MSHAGQQTAIATALPVIAAAQIALAAEQIAFATKQMPLAAGDYVLVTQKIEGLL